MSLGDVFVPLLFIGLLIAASFKRVNAYNSFISGAKKGFLTAMDLLPFVTAVFIAILLFRESGLVAKISSFLSPALELLGIPPPLTQLILLKPLSGSGSLAILNDIYKEHGVDSYVSRAASVIMGSSETVFYISTVYFANTKVKKTGKAVALGLLVSFISVLISCWVCKAYFGE